MTLELQSENSDPVSLALPSPAAHNNRCTNRLPPGGTTRPRLGAALGNGKGGRAWCQGLASSTPSPHLRYDETLAKYRSIFTAASRVSHPIIGRSNKQTTNTTPNSPREAASPASLSGAPAKSDLDSPVATGFAHCPLTPGTPTSAPNLLQWPPSPRTDDPPPESRGPLGWSGKVPCLFISPLLLCSWYTHC